MYFIQITIQMVRQVNYHDSKYLNQDKPDSEYYHNNRSTLLNTVYCKLFTVENFHGSIWVQLEYTAPT